jgi:hypothetical protein
MRRAHVSHNKQMRDLSTSKQFRKLQVSDIHRPKAVPMSRPNGAANKLAPEDAPAHHWYRFVLSFPPHLVRDYLERFRIGPNQTVLDPFCGTGTTLVECKKLGVPSIGIEAHPMSHFAAATKTNWTPNPDVLLSHATRIAKAASRKLTAQGIDDSNNALLPRSFTPMTLSIESMSILLTDSISPLPLHKTLVLLQCLAAGCNPSLESHEKLALAQALVTTVGNLHFGPEVGIGKIKDDSPVISSWLARIERMSADLRSLQNRAVVPSTVLLADAREIPSTIPPGSIDAVFTSPPYPNEKDYTRTTRLESVLLGFVKNKKELQAFKRSFVRSNTRSVYKDDQDHTWIEDFPKISRLARKIEARRIALGKTSGFEKMYHKVTLLYFGGMARHLESLRKYLRPGAMLGYVVGDQASYLRVMIRTGHLLADIACSLGYELVGIDLFRTRKATATKEQLREEVVVLRWPG